MYSQFDEARASVKASVLKGDFTSALEEIKQFIVTAMNLQSTPGEVVGARKVDELCELVGSAYAQTQPTPPFKANDKRMVIVCTGLYKYGGTTLVISDLVKAHPGWECTVIATNYLDDMTDDDLHLSRIGNSGADVSISPKGDGTQKLGWLMQQFHDIAPSRIFLLNHHQDSVMISAASQFVEKTKVIFYHHADYNICLGVHLKGAIHVDPHNVGFYNCRDKECIEDNVYLPMTVDDQKISRVWTNFMELNTLTTCSSGSYHKFRNFYLYPYIDRVIDRLRALDGKHIHIGGIPSGELDHIRRELTAGGVSAGRFVHIPWVPSLWQALVAEEVDLFIASFPIGGARSTIEAMGAGIPMLMPVSYLSRFFSSRDIVYPEAFQWRTPSDFWHALVELTPATLAEHSAMSRTHYLKYYSPESADLEGKINAICSGEPIPDAPELYPYEPDALDRALHFGELANMRKEHDVRHAVHEASQRRPGLLRAFKAMKKRLVSL